MTTGYCVNMVITLMTLIGLVTLVHANGRVDRDVKRRFYVICALIMFSAFWEWLSLFLNGAPAWTTGLHVLAKGMDYIFTPICSVVFIRQVVPERKKSWLMYGILGGNAVLQILSAFTGWTYYIDAENYYCHGPLYLVYSIVTVLALLFVIYAFWEYGKKYERRNRVPLVAIFVLMAACIAMQELLGNEGKASYLGMAIASCLMYIHYTEFDQIEHDRMLATDALTGVMSRFAYKQVAADYLEKGPLPRWLVAFESDLNGLKFVNDTIGHEAGDELLRGTGAVMRQVIGSCGRVFRTGGDEFVILLDSRAMPPEQAVKKLREASAAWKSDYGSEMSLSIGCATVTEFPNHDLPQLVHEADQRMYADKDFYYSQPGHDRRRGPRGSQKPE